MAYMTAAYESAHRPLQKQLAAAAAKAKAKKKKKKEAAKSKDQGGGGELHRCVRSGKPSSRCRCCTTLHCGMRHRFAPEKQI